MHPRVNICPEIKNKINTRKRCYFVICSFPIQYFVFHFDEFVYDFLLI